MDVLDFKRGSNLKIYLKDNIFYIVGHYYANEEKGDDFWFALNVYSKYSKEDKKVMENHSNDDKAIIVVRLCDVEHMEFFN